MQLMLKPLSKSMDKLIKLNKKLYDIECNLEDTFCEGVYIKEIIDKMNKITMTMQMKCACYKV